MYSHTTGQSTVHAPPVSMKTMYLGQASGEASVVVPPPPSPLRRFLKSQLNCSMKCLNLFMFLSPSYSCPMLYESSCASAYYSEDEISTHKLRRSRVSLVFLQIY